MRALSEVDLAQLDKLPTYARAAAHAHAVVMAASTVPPMRELAAHASCLRQLLCSDASALANRGLIDRRCLSGLKGPNGYQNLAFRWRKREQVTPDDEMLQETLVPAHR